MFRDSQAWEQVLQDGLEATIRLCALQSDSQSNSSYRPPTHLEEAGVVYKELGQVAVPESTDQYHVLGFVGILSLQ